MCVYIFFFSILFHYMLLQNIEYSSLCYTVNPCHLSVFVYGKPHTASNLQVLFPGRNVVKGSEAIHSRILKEFLVPSILGCKYFEAVSSSLTEADVVGDMLVCNDNQ